MAREDDGASLIWFIAGASIGAAVALLYAPQSGEDTRRLIGRKAREGGEVINQQGREMMDRGRELYDRGKRMADEAAEMFDRGRKIVNKAGDAVGENLNG